MKYLENIGIKAKKAFENLKRVEHRRIQKALREYKRLLQLNESKIIKENLKDVKKSKRKNLIDRLALNEDKMHAIRNSIVGIKDFKNPIGQVLSKWKRSNKLWIEKISIPIGVIGVIYESRPNVTADVAALCLKSGNCVILRGGSEAYYTNKILSDLFREALGRNKIDKNCVQFIENQNRNIVDYMLSGMESYVDVIVPRGGKSLVEKVKKLSKVNVIGHLEGLCHIYVDKDANVEMAKKVVLNAKMRRTSICGALETLLINERIISSHGTKIINALIDEGCEVRVDNNINKYFDYKLKKATKQDWKTEYLDKIISIKTVKNVEEAVDHILKYGTMHTDSIITNNFGTAKYFLEGVNSSIAMHNTSTQFADGGEFGFGAEIGISTNKMPPRGPVGINQLTSYKYIVKGNGAIRS
tara:strand:- start:3210 stop:4451 length:1242 start_codon:yes stop_codon:yes gene_type:complete